MSGLRHVKTLFDLTGRVVVVTGGGGFLGRMHAAAVAEAGGVPVLLDIDEAGLAAARDALGGRTLALTVDITSREAVEAALSTILGEFGRLDGLVNNAANNPKMEPGASNQTEFSRLESFPMATWDCDIAVGLTGALICTQVFGGWMASSGGGGAIVNIASDLAVIAPDQRIYRKSGLPEDQQPVKPVTYSVVKAGLVGLTRYVATYWATAGVRCNAISPAGVYNNHDEAFVARLTNLIPMARMAQPDELKGAVVFLLSDSSSFVTGLNLLVDGGRTIW
jgi:NAD(P)-dependent dehydrogenase (short-subunit alcohol dehydrogenase family)